jgi:predicted RNA-binding protein with PUA-like domain
VSKTAATPESKERACFVAGLSSISESGYAARKRAPRRASHPSNMLDEPMPFLVKEEPDHYGFDAFVKDGGTEWSGVKNPLAQKHLRSMRKGDLVFYYHTGDEKAIVGIARAAANARPDSADPSGKAHVVDLVPVKKLKRPVTLAEIKADKRFKEFPLTYIPRLSVMPVDDRTWDAILEMAQD